MSFGINGPGKLPAIQQSHQTNDGGAGNLGYFQRRKKDEDEDESQEDIFESSKKDDEAKEDVLMLELDSIGSRIKSFWNKLHSKNTDEPDEDK